MQDPVGSFLRHIETTKRYSPNTVAAYRRDLERLLAFVGADAASFDPARLTTDDVRAWIVSLSEEGLKPASINRMLSAWGAFYKYLLREGAVEADPFRKVSALKKPTTLPVFIPESKMSRLVTELTAEMEEGSDFCSRRDALMVLFLYATGIRLAELIAIDRTDFESGFRELHVRGKGDKERVVPIVPELRVRIRAYVDAIKSENICFSGEKALFLTNKGNRISRSEVYRAIRRQLAQFGVQGKCSPHVLRHTFATHMMNSGADLREIQELLGHASLRATQVYTHNSIAQLKAVYDEAHPHARKR